MSLLQLEEGREAEVRSIQALQMLAESVENEEPLAEFQSLRQLKATDDSLVAKSVVNKTRNRYRNVLPCK